MRKLMEEFELEFWTVMALLAFIHFYDILFVAAFGKGLGILLHH